MEFVNAVRERLRRYRPRLERVLFGLSLLGVLDVVHLYIQQTRQFEDGCLGFASLDAAASTFDCATVTSGPGSELFGVSNITWGLGFYLFVAALTVLVFWVAPKIRTWVQGGRTVVLTGGVLYSGYLTYLQVDQLDAFCLLCLGSALVATLLFATQIAILALSSSSTESPMPSRLVKRQIALFVYFVATTLVLVGADVVYFDAAEPSPQHTRAAASSDSSGPAQCRLDTTKATVGDKGASLVGFRDITKGGGEAGVTVIEYFDPNCPHCKDFHGIMKKVMEAHSDVRYVFKPFALRRSSLPEIQALYVAAQSGKFSEMLNGQYARQGRSGINMSDLRAIASEIGMNPDVLENRIQQNEYRDQALRLRKRAVKIGVDSTPTVLVNGHFVQSRTLKCMNTFIERAKSGTLGGSATSK
jgi:protein-disulfide isomerase